MLATKEIGYRDGETELTGFLAADDTRPDPRPGLLLLHGGAGLDSHAREQTLRYAALGYVVFACDMYGSSVAGDREQVIGAIKGLLREPEAMLARGLAGLRVLEDCPQFNGQAAAVGFCFGGRSALEFAAKRHGPGWRREHPRLLGFEPALRTGVHQVEGPCLSRWSRSPCPASSGGGVHPQDEHRRSRLPGGHLRQRIARLHAQAPVCGPLRGDGLRPIR